jgi:hypothetical protein
MTTLSRNAVFYSELRTHRSLNKDTSIDRANQHVDSIVSPSVLGGLHHHYVRIWVFGTHSQWAVNVP